jgi:hypothetical protein
MKFLRIVCCFRLADEVINDSGSKLEANHVNEIIEKRKFCMYRVDAGEENYQISNSI